MDFDLYENKDFFDNIHFHISVAEVQLQTNEFNISSTLTFKQLSIADPLIIHGRIIGLPPGKGLEIT